MSSIQSLSSFLNQYKSIMSGSGSSSSSTGSTSSSSSASSLLLELQAEESASDSTSTSDSSTDDVVGSVFSKASALSEFYGYTSSLSSSASTLYSESEDSTDLNTDDISSFVSAYNNLINYADENTSYVSANQLESIKQNVTDAADSLSSIGITVNSDGTMTVDNDTLESALTDDATSVASTLNSLTSNTKASAKTLTNSSLENYIASFKESIAGYTKLSKCSSLLDYSSSDSSLFGQLLDSSS